MIPDSIVLHHSATKDQKVRDWDAIKRFHTSWRFGGEIVNEEQAQFLITQGRKVEPPWNDIGYHYGIEWVEFQYIICPGRRENVSGAHCSQGGMNLHSLGICFVGNFDLISPPTGQWLKGVELVASLCQKYSIPVSRIYGHRDFAPKTCPGKNFSLMTFCMDVVEILNPKKEEAV